MAKQTEVEWLPCERAGCLGVRVTSGCTCLAHASEEQTAAVLKLVGETGMVDARGVSVTPALLERILAAAPRGENGEPLINGCRFNQATFTGKAWFGGATFSGDTDFRGGTFSSDTNFRGATFHLVLEAHDGHPARRIDDDETITVTKHSVFSANDCDDDS
jgi:hypothetical protein